MSEPVKPARGTSIPPSSCAGIVWPAIPGKITADILAVQYQLDQSQWWSAETLLRAQLGQLELLLRHAAQTAPLYRDRLNLLKDVAPGALTMEQVARIPILKRSDIQAAGDDLLSRRPPRDHGKVGIVQTSGSTGSPIRVRSTGITGLYWQVLNLRSHLWHGRAFSGRVGCIRNLANAAPDPDGDNKGAGWAPGFRSGQMVFFDITRPVSEQLDWLIKTDPDYLLTFPSNLKALLQHSHERGIRPKSLRQVATMSETLDPAVRENCMRIWNAPIADSYSSEELGFIALQCPENTHYHVQSESLLVEILDGDGTPCGPGRVGRLVITDLHNFASPLIRYEVGDYAEFGDACSCGRGLPVLNRIAGRTRNMLTLPSGDRIWPSFPESQMMPIAPIRQFQIVQHDLRAVEARFVTARKLTDDEIGQLRTYLIKCLQHDFELELVFVDKIARASNGKYEDFISRVGL